MSSLAVLSPRVWIVRVTSRAAVRISRGGGTPGAAMLALATMLASGQPHARDETLCGRDGRSMARLMADLMREARGQPLFEDMSFVSFRDQGSGAVFLFTKIGQAAHPAVICRAPVRGGAGEGEAAPTQVQTVCTAPQEACETLVEQIRAMP